MSGNLSFQVFCITYTTALLSGLPYRRREAISGEPSRGFGCLSLHKGYRIHLGNQHRRPCGHTLDIHEDNPLLSKSELALVFNIVPIAERAMNTLSFTNLIPFPGKIIPSQLAQGWA